LHYVVEAGRIPNSNTALMPTRFPHGLAARNLAPLPAPTHELNLGRSLPAFFSEVSLYPIHLRQLNRIVDEER